MPTVIRCKAGQMVVRCKACHQHFIQTPRWSFNGDMEKPTFSPSVSETCNAEDHPSYRKEAATSRCHFTITNGMIQYHGDCTHDLKGQTLPLEAWTEEQIAYYNGPGFQE